MGECKKNTPYLHCVTQFNEKSENSCFFKDVYCRSTSEIEYKQIVSIKTARWVGLIFQIIWYIDGTAGPEYFRLWLCLYERMFVYVLVLLSVDYFSFILKRSGFFFLVFGLHSCLSCLIKLRNCIVVFNQKYPIWWW